MCGELLQRTHDHLVLSGTRSSDGLQFGRPESGSGMCSSGRHDEVGQVGWITSVDTAVYHHTQFVDDPLWNGQSAMVSQQWSDMFIS